MLSQKRLQQKMAYTRVLGEQDQHPPLIALAGRQDTPRESAPHHHATGQLLGLFSGVMSVRTELGVLVLPNSRAVWIPPSHIHSAQSHGPFDGWAVYVSPQACATLPEQPRVFEVSGLLRESVLRAAQWDVGPLQASQQHLIDVILDEIRESREDSFTLPMLRDPRLVRIANALIDDPADSRTLNQWAEWAHVTPRTLSRRFVVETGLTFTIWRQRARMFRALELLAAGAAVTHIALELGYDSASAFIALFRRTFGTTPGRYLTTNLPQL
ncbi:AraC family transcriptional regulator [Herbaspirillum camelliae]|uniref:AraC family transcriptional regulator n=1 Tax=Herbaspirillum camelliae TaxID=1892903 RepID=UPI001E5712F2|nr:helix-turn-helix transcriptional regulator [Herbaspirillum camelliae]